jgi:cytoskeletal protein CcmA (bactofilin family)
LRDDAPRRRVGPELALVLIHRMAIFGKDREGKERTQDASPPVPRAEPIASREGTMFERNTTQAGVAGGTDAFLGKGTKVTGKIVLEGTGRIEGHVEGEISAQDTLTIGEGATVNAKVSGTTIVVEGHVTGDITARQRLELRASARVQGNVTSASLVVQEGAILDGQCAMSGAGAKAAREKHESKPEPATQNLDRTRDTSMQVASAIGR